METTPLKQIKRRLNQLVGIFRNSFYLNPDSNENKSLIDHLHFFLKEDVF